MSVIVISRQFGAGGKTLGEMVSQKLEYTFVDNEIIQMVAKKAKVSRNWVESIEKEAGGKLLKFMSGLVRKSFIERILDNQRGYIDEEIYVDLLHEIISQIAEEGNVLILGRGGQYVLRDHSNVFCVLLIAEKADRIRFMEEHYDLSPAQALQSVNREDKRRVNLYRKFGKENYDQPDLYHLVLNMSKLSEETKANLARAEWVREAAKSVASKSEGWTPKSRVEDIQLYVCGYAEPGYSDPPSGVIATVVATPCTAPFMGAALGWALLRPPAETMLVFTALGTGMAAPYLALSLAPGLVDRLPPPGRWMETLKQLLAFPLLATVVWLAWVFQSDFSVSWGYEGPFVDEIQVWGYEVGAAPSPTPTPDPLGLLIQNGSFEDPDEDHLIYWDVETISSLGATEEGTAPSSPSRFVSTASGEVSVQSIGVLSDTYVDGDWSAYLWQPAGSDWLYQTFYMPANVVDVELNYWFAVTTWETEGGQDIFCASLRPASDLNAILVDMGCLDAVDDHPDRAGHHVPRPSAAPPSRPARRRASRVASSRSKDRRNPSGSRRTRAS